MKLEKFSLLYIQNEASVLEKSKFYQLDQRQKHSCTVSVTGPALGCDEDDAEPGDEEDTSLPDCIRCCRVPVGCRRLAGIACTRCSRMKAICIPVSSWFSLLNLSNHFTDRNPFPDYYRFPLTRRDQDSVRKGLR